MPDADWLEALQGLFDWFVRTFGPDTAVVLMIVLFVLAVGYRLWTEWRRDRWYEKAMDEKERTIQRVADQERAWRAYFMMQEGGMNVRTVEKFLMENRFQDARDSRETLEKKKKKKKK